MNFEQFLADFETAKARNEAFVVITLVNAKGSAPQEIGARMIVNFKGYFAGTIGGGKLEFTAIQQAKDYLLKKIKLPQFTHWNLQTDLKMSCGGEVSLFYEIHNPEVNWKIVIFGAGHVAQELICVLLRLECQITCYDTRPEWIEKLPKNKKLTSELVASLPEEIKNISNDCFVVLATMGHASDFPVLEAALKTKSFQYLGVLGSEVKAKKMRQQLKESFFSTEQMNSYFCPTGENIGNNTPAEIAISICAQLLKYRDLNQSGFSGEKSNSVDPTIRNDF